MEYKENLEDFSGEMLDRLESMHYALDCLRSEINLLPELTSREQKFFSSLNKCLNMAELISFDNIARCKKAVEE